MIWLVVLVSTKVLLKFRACLVLSYKRLLKINSIVTLSSNVLLQTKHALLYVYFLAL